VTDWRDSRHYNSYKKKYLYKEKITTPKTNELTKVINTLITKIMINFISKSKLSKKSIFYPSYLSVKNKKTN
jgi:hypothetical protein